MKTDTKKVTCLIVSTEFSGMLRKYLKDKGFEQVCFDKRETHYHNSKILNKKEKDAIAAEISKRIVKQAVDFYTDEVEI